MNQVLPFIDVTRLVAAMEPLCEHLTEQERARNTHGAVKEYKKVYNGSSGIRIMSTYGASKAIESPDEGTHSMAKQLHQQQPDPTGATLQQLNSDRLPVQSPEVSSLQVGELDFSHSFLLLFYILLFVTFSSNNRLIECTRQSLVIGVGLRRQLRVMIQRFNLLKLRPHRRPKK